MIKSFLIKLRQKPKHVRQQVAFGVAATFTAIVGLFWLASIPQTFQNIGSGVSSGANTFDTFRESLDKEINSAKQRQELNIASVIASTTNEAFLIATSSGTTSVLNVGFATSSPSTSSPAREVRIATTTSSTSQVIIQ